jgi:SAM-dependent methyltransferase
MPGYDRTFYDSVNSAGDSSAGVVLPLALSLLSVESAVDIGCGTGIWAAALAEYGVTDVIGVDGSYVPSDQRRLPAYQFVEKDISKPLALGRVFDLALCLEVGEHLPADQSTALIDNVVSCASAAVFSAAAPGQLGTDHINEQWPDYWVSLFEERGWTCWDLIRPAIRYDSRVAWIYRQNIWVALAAGHPVASDLPGTARLRPADPGDVSFEYVARYVLEREDGLAATAQRLPRLIGKSIRSRIRR